MPDREKVLKALEHHKETAVCNGCPYAEDDDTVEGSCPVYDDAIALLREQEPVEPIVGEYGARLCGNCRQQVGAISDSTPYKIRQNYCPECGRKVKWNEPPDQSKA